MLSVLGVKSMEPKIYTVTHTDLEKLRQLKWEGTLSLSDGVPDEGRYIKYSDYQRCIETLKMCYGIDHYWEAKRKELLP